MAAAIFSFESPPVILIAISLGCAVGAVARYQVGIWVAGLSQSGFPWNTLVVNITGSLLIGCFMASAQQADALGWLMLTQGFCGGYTTYSSFGIQTILLYRQGKPKQALGNIAANFILCLAGVAAGFQLVNFLGGNA